MGEYNKKRAYLVPLNVCYVDTEIAENIYHPNSGVLLIRGEAKLTFHLLKKLRNNKVRYLYVFLTKNQYLKLKKRIELTVKK